MSEALCKICPISASRVLHRTGAGSIVVPDQTIRPGHIMVVSATHARSFADAKPVEADAFMTLVAAATRAAEQASGAERYYVIRIGDKSPHLHFHLIPRVEGEPSLAPFVFGDHGWAGDVRKDATPPEELFDQAFASALRLESIDHRVEEDAGRLPAWLVKMAISMLAGLAIFPIAWRLAGGFSPALMLVAAATTGSVLSDRMKGQPIRWGMAAVAGLCTGAVASGMMYWLRGA